MTPRLIPPHMPQKLLVLVPTRNRSDLAERSARSALDASGDGSFKVVVSDNSDDPTEVRMLSTALGSLADSRLAQIRPPHPMRMADHWDWAIQHCLDHFSPTHLVILTDRMTFRGKAIVELSTIVARHPDRLISYRNDSVRDLQTPVVLERAVHSGYVCEVQSRRLLEMASRASFHFGVPRLLNCVTPVSALLRVKAAFGDYCRTVAPDYGFGYRYLATHPDLLIYDKALIVASALSRSNGASTARGVYSKDAVNFMATNTYTHAPYPEITTVGNAILEEYYAVRDTPAFAGLPPMRAARYVKLLCAEAMAMEDAGSRRHLYSQLVQRGHRWALYWHRFRAQFKLRTRWLEKRLRRLVRGPNALGTPGLSFATVDEALAWDARHPPVAAASTRHLRLLEPKLLLDAPLS